MLFISQRLYFPIRKLDHFRNNLFTGILAGIFLFFIFHVAINASDHTDLLSSNPESAPHSTLNIGVAKLNITPGEPVVMAGYGHKEPFKGIHDSIYATAIFFDNGNQKALILTTDLIGFSHETWEELTSHIEKATGIRQKYILLTAVHNHGGPSTRVYTDSKEDKLLRYNENLKDKLVVLTKDAISKTQPALLGVGKGICKMNTNRREVNAKGEMWLGINPYGACDHEVAVLRMDNKAGNPFAVFINWPCHGTIMGPDNYLITGDWPGETRRYVEKEFGSPLLASFTAGASGDIDPIFRVLPDFESGAILKVSRIMGQEVVKVTKEIQTYPVTAINAVQRVITLPGKAAGTSLLPQESYDPGPEVNVRLSVLKIGNIVFAGISGELFNEIGAAIKELSPLKNTFIVTHCNGSSGYLITDKAYKYGGYEVRTTRVMPGFAEKAITANLVDMIYELSNE